jgi:hypothetical protein
MAHQGKWLSFLYSTFQILWIRVLISIDAPTVIPVTSPKHHNKILWQNRSLCPLLLLQLLLLLFDILSVQFLLLSTILYCLHDTRYC